MTFNNQPRPSLRDPLVTWVWRSYFRTSLIPLLCVEVALIVIYILSNAATNRINLDAMREMASDEAQRLSQGEARNINQILQGIRHASEFLQIKTAEVMSGNSSGNLDSPSRYTTSPEGVLHTFQDDGRPALFYSAFTPLTQEKKEKAYRSGGLDDYYIGVQQTNPLVVQIYYNTHDSMNRIYPYFDVVNQYPTKMNIPSYNFYYEATGENNPERKVVWTDVYKDPAGQGWMTSAIVPVYIQDQLEGVVGLDITVDNIVKGVLNLDIPWHGYGMLVSRSGNIIALPEHGYRDWGITEPHDPVYQDKVHADTFSSIDFNLLSHKKALTVVHRIREENFGVTSTALNGNKIISWAAIPETDWKLVITLPEEEIFKGINSVAHRLSQIAYLIVGGMLVFYLAFFIILYRRAKVMSDRIARPLETIDHMVSQIAAGEYLQKPPAMDVTELHDTAKGIANMGLQLDQARLLRLQAQQSLQERSQELQSIFDRTPNGLIMTDAQARIALVNPAFQQMLEIDVDDWLGQDEAQIWEKLHKHIVPGKFDPEQVSMDGFRLEIAVPRHLVLLCVIVNISPDANHLGKLFLFNDITREDNLDQIKGNFLITAAHELRTPLTSILAYAELLKNKMLPESMHAEALHSIFNKAQRLKNIVAELLDLSQIEKNKSADAQLKPTPVLTQLQKVMEEFPVPSGRQSPVLTAEGNWLIRIDPEKFGSLINNILDNAYKYSATDPIHIAVSHDSTSGEHRVYIRITDSGIGLSPEDLAHIYERFWRADNIGTIPGTGLGMAIVQEIMKIFDGSLEVESQLGKGTTVKLGFKKVS